MGQTRRPKPAEDSSRPYSTAWTCPAGGGDGRRAIQTSPIAASDSQPDSQNISTDDSR